MKTLKLSITKLPVCCLLAAGLSSGLFAASQPDSAAPTDSLVSLVADTQGLALMPPEKVPPLGTFWLVMPGGRGFCFAPMPCPPLDPSLPIYFVTARHFLVDGTRDRPAAFAKLPAGKMSAGKSTEETLLAEADALVRLIQQIQSAANTPQMRTMDVNGFLSDNGYSFIDTNRLWLEMITVTNRTASLVIHPPWNVTNEVYDLHYCTNLAPPIAWRWLLRSYPRVTNLIVPNAKDAQGFYRLSSPDDNTANSSLGTNFWLMFPGMFNNFDNQLSLYVSSPVASTGRVTFPGIISNGPLLIVTNCGDAVLNGTYVLTNLTAQQQTDWQLYSLDTVGYVKGTNWAGFMGTESVLFGYDSATHVCTFWYTKPGINLNGSSNDWQNYFFHTNLPAPTTICARITASQTFTVAAGGVTNIPVPLLLLKGDPNSEYDLIETNSLHVTANHPVSVYGMNYNPTASAAFTGYPTPLLGTNYCLIARPSWTFYGFSELAVTATADNTTVTIIPSPTANLEGHANSYNKTLQQGQTYQINSLNDAGGGFSDDVTGTRVTSDKPIAVFAGATLAIVPDADTLSGNPLMQQQMPIDSWGKQVLALSFAGRTGGDSYRVLAAFTNTIVLTNGVVVGTYQAGQFLDLTNSGPVEFRGSQPIQVAHFANGLDLSGYGDPCEILLPPIAHYLMTNIVETPAEGFDINYLNIIVIQSAITNTVLDGSTVAATNFMAIGTSGYFGAQLSVTNGVHKVKSSQPVGVEVYGFGDHDAYGYFGGIVK